MPGSSPLTRGKQALPDVGRAVMRLIPAHAGKTTRWGRPASVSPAHPRSRGENVATTYTVGTRRGSSPLTWGKLPVLRRQLPGPGLIPAHAGKTCRSVLGQPGLRAHPRSRGENDLLVICLIGYLGSSPLTRGKRSPEAPRRRPVRLIPAHAGKTADLDTPTAQHAAHPRSRGENRMSVAVTLSGLGSSPLTRGKPRSRG